MPPKQKDSLRVLEKLLLVLCVALGVVLVTMAVFGENGLLTYMQLKAKYTIMEEKVEGIQSNNGRLKKEIRALKTDPAAIENAAREQLGMIKRDEVLYKIQQGGEQ